MSIQGYPTRPGPTRAEKEFTASQEPRQQLIAALQKALGRRGTDTRQTIIIKVVASREAQPS
jgi:hypothetical protein